ncbi:hypothetical protein SERLADRAFT_474530 [Serpula lacrymans var. lacrymans S7.9]|uniref:DUF6534 domain-containing protein n=1 Tax=Serpula lacrymans var. lacrymans (strain S7.9) TaxID=578457 RepID=F8P542_SERL9|nr:uncharacterized protein SERLADRAFT_474530 [Serpula lacrymans var. lacrymans S7.9]EGO21729.1 hypothetical protein SERLADRAFT_474530 [Serpula lacrymans var. lacrymans S7.9]
MSEFYSSDTSLSTPSYPPPSPATWSVEVFYGPLYWGFVLATSLVGATVVQAYMYFSRNSDRWSLRLLVTVLLILDVASTVLMGQAIFHYFVVNFANVDVFFEVPISWWAEKALSTLITCMTQLYFASRIYIINRTCAILPGYGRFLPVAVSFFAVAGLMGGLSETYFMSVWPTSQFASTTMQVIVILEDGSAVLSDILVTTTLSYILSPSRTGVVQRSSRLRNLFFFVMNRGIIVTIFQVGVLVAYLGARSYLYWMPFHLCKSKLYANTLRAFVVSAYPMLI